jgi:hypothetical protein
MTRPLFTPTNHVYNGMEKAKFDRLMSLIKEIGELLNANRPGSDAYAGDDLICWFRNLGFLDDPEFIAATEPYKASQVVRSKLWRIATYCWATRTAPGILKTMMDLGCYDGKTVDIAQRYTPGHYWMLYDAFDEHPNGEDKERHGEGLYEAVKEKLVPNYTSVVKGLLPESIKFDWRNQEIAFVHCDLNDGETEVKCLEKLWPKIVQGGIILLDDHGWKMYRASQEAHNEFFKSKGQVVLEVPTGQGIVIKR